MPGWPSGIPCCGSSSSRSAACGIYLLTQLEVVPNHLLWVYVPTAAGGLILTYLLFVSRLVPRPIALLGLVGYRFLAVGVPLDLLGVLDMDAGAGQALLVPGGLFEALVLPIWLLTKGFQTPRAHVAAAATPRSDALTAGPPSHPIMLTRVSGSRSASAGRAGVLC